MDAYELDNAAYAHMRKHGIHRTKKSGPRKGQTVHETVGGKPFKANALKKRAAPTHKELLKQNPRLKRDSKGNYSY